MVAKSKSGSGIGGIINYLFDGEMKKQQLLQDLLMAEKQATVLLCEGLSEPLNASDLAGRKALVNDFKMQASLNPNLRKNVQHTILSFAKTDSVSVEKMVSISADYIKRAGLSNTQYIAIRHEDREHEHVHIVANRVDNTGKTISDQFIKMRDIERAQVLAIQYGLTPTLSRKRKKKGIINEEFFEQKEDGKNLDLTNQNRLSHDQQVKYTIFETLNRHTSGDRMAKDMEELRDRLEQEAISMQFYEKEGIIIGVGFSKDAFKFSGVQIDKNYSYGKLKGKLEKGHLTELNEDVSNQIITLPVPDSSSTENVEVKRSIELEEKKKLEAKVKIAQPNKIRFRR